MIKFRWDDRDGVEHAVFVQVLYVAGLINVVGCRVLPGILVVGTGTGDKSVAGIKIDPKVVNPAEVDLLEDLVTAAVDGALAAAKELAAKELGKVTAGLNIPGLG